MPDVMIGWGKDGKRRLYYGSEEYVIGTVKIRKDGPSKTVPKVPKVRK